MTASSLSSALAYARRGLRVLPIEPRGKVPIGALVPHGVKNATTDTATIRAWWSRQPLANIAIAVPDDWRVLDVDVRNGGGADLARFVAAHGPLPPTISARTGGGGEHHLVVFPAGVPLRGKVTPGIDLLGPGRYFLVAPSIVPVDAKGNANPNGGAYAWTSGQGAKIAQAPEWLVRRARVENVSPAPFVPSLASVDVIDRARRYLAKCAPAVSGQGGHIQALLVAQRLVRGFLLDETTAFALLWEDWNPTCAPPWSKWDLRRKVREAARAGRMVPGALLDAPKRRA